MGVSRIRRSQTLRAGALTTLILVMLGATALAGRRQGQTADVPAAGLADTSTLPASWADTITLAFDYAGAKSLLAALERKSLAAADVDSLLRIQGVRAMVDNVTRFFPAIGEGEFRRTIQAVTQSRWRSESDGYFRLRRAHRARERTRALIARLRASESAIQRQALAKVAPYQPRSGSMTITAYFVVGGVSTGFVPDNTNAANFYANLTDADGDYDGVVSNVAHEAYHLMQKAAQRRAGLVAIADSVESLPGSERLLATTLAEGTAKYLDGVAGRAADTSHGRIKENFAVFDEVLAGLRDGSLAWAIAYERGFTSRERERFYFVGYEMTRAIDRQCGRACVAQLFEQHPVEFFRQYVRLYRTKSDIVGRFAPATEAFLARPHSRRPR